MGGKTLLVTIFMLAMPWPLAAQPQQQESLADLARQVRQQHDKDAKKTTKVFTNDNLPSPIPGEAVNMQPVPPTPEVNPPTAEQTPSNPATSPPSEETGGKKPESPEDKAKTRDYWQGKFKAARQDLARAKSAQQLAEDELNLLQIQQVREIDPAAKAELTSRVQAKQSEVDTNKTTVESAQKDLDDLAVAFKDSGAPDDWSLTD